MHNGCLIGLLTVGVGADSYPFACSLDHFPPTRLPYSSLQWRFVPSLIITCYAMLSWYPWEASLLFFFFKGNRRGVVGWEGEVARRRTGKSRGRGKCDLDAKHERIKEKKITWCMFMMKCCNVILKLCVVAPFVSNVVILHGFKCLFLNFSYWNTCFVAFFSMI